MQIERRHSNKQKFFFGAVEFKFEPDMTVIIKNLAQKVDFRAKCRSKEDCRSICASMVCTVIPRLARFLWQPENRVR